MFEPEIISKESVEAWVNFSTNPRTEQEIIDMLLDNPSGLCMSYICRYSRLSEEFIEKLIVVSTGLLTRNNYNKYYNKIKKVMNQKYFGVKDGEKVITFEMTDRSGNKIKVTPLSISDRLDWEYITEYQNLSHDFIRKYVRNVDKQYLIRSQSIPKELKLELVEALKSEMSLSMIKAQFSSLLKDNSSYSSVNNE